MAKVYLDAVGTVIRLNMGTDVSAASAIMLEVHKPDGTEDEWTAAVDGADDEAVTYTTAADDLDQVGEYLIQPLMTFDTMELLGDTVRMVVHPPYDRPDMIPVAGP
jgi:hypothetical protein